MARKGMIYKFTVPAGGSGSTPSFRAELGTDEAGGTVRQERVAVLTLDGTRFDSLTAGEETAFRAVTLGDIIDAAFHATVEI